MLDSSSTMVAPSVAAHPLRAVDFSHLNKGPFTGLLDERLEVLPWARGIVIQLPKDGKDGKKMSMLMGGHCASPNLKVSGYQVQ